MVVTNVVYLLFILNPIRYSICFRTLQISPTALRHGFLIVSIKILNTGWFKFLIAVLAVTDDMLQFFAMFFIDGKHCCLESAHRFR